MHFSNMKIFGVGFVAMAAVGHASTPISEVTSVTTVSIQSEKSYPHYWTGTATTDPFVAFTSVEVVHYTIPAEPFLSVSAGKTYTVWPTPTESVAIHSEKSQSDHWTWTGVPTHTSGMPSIRPVSDKPTFGVSSGRIAKPAVRSDGAPYAQISVVNGTAYNGTITKTNSTVIVRTNATFTTTAPTSTKTNGAVGNVASIGVIILATTIFAVLLL